MRRWIPISIVTVILCLLVAVPIAMFLAAAVFAQAERQQATRAVEHAKLAQAEARERAELERREAERRLREAEMARVRQELEKTEREVEALRRSGRVEEAEILLRRARELAQRLRVAQEHAEREHAEHEHAEHGEEFHEHAHPEFEHAHPPGMDRVRHLHEAAEHMQAAGYGEQAHDLHAEAERLERQLHGGAPPEQFEHLQRQLDELREHHAQLTEHVHRLAEAVERLQRRLEERER